MRKILVSLLLILVGIIFIKQKDLFKKNEGIPDQLRQTGSEETSTPSSSEPQIIASNLEIPWELAFLPDGRMLVTERAGRLLVIAKQQALLIGDESKNYEVKNVAHIGEGGLLGLVLDPDFSKNNFIYLYFTYRDGGKVMNKVQRFTFKNDSLTEDKVILDKIPGASNHDGGRIKFGPDKKLYITTGDAQNPASAQDTNSLSGKILVYDGSKIEFYSYGHRNPQGLAWDTNGDLWATEHGPSGFGGNCCRDEVNLIKKGSNYGWPDSFGDKVLGGTIGPVLHSGNSTTWAPSGAVIADGKLYFAGLRGEALYSMDLKTRELQTHFKGIYGRIRSVSIGPDGAFYLITSNRDGRGSPVAEDDRIIKIHSFKESSFLNLFVVQQSTS